MERKIKILNNLKEYFKFEVIRSEKKFSWLLLMHRVIKCPDRRYHFWWRLANHLYITGGRRKKKIASRINTKLRNKYGIDIKLGASIGKGLSISHYVGIVIADSCIIGENFYIKQNTTIGVKTVGINNPIIIGNNVEVGANSCIIGDNLTIGDNVTIGAMSFINTDVPSNCTVYTPKSHNVIKNK